MAKRLDLKRVLSAIDNKDYDFYDKLDDEEKKAFSAFLMMRYESSVQGGPDLQEWFIRATNERVNLHLFDLSKHPKLQWLSIVSASPGIGNQFHPWIGMKKKTAGNNNKIKSFLSDVYPGLKDNDLDLLVQINSKKEIKQLAKDLGLDDKQIKSKL